MDFRFTDDQQELIDAAASMFKGENTLERLRAMATGEKVSGLWPQFAELGLLGLMAPEEAGGLSQPLVVMAGIAEAAGYSGIAEPVIEVAGITVPCLIEAAITGDELRDVIAGRKIVTILSELRPYIHCADEVDGFLCGNDFAKKADVNLLHVKSIDPLRRLFKVSSTGVGSQLAKKNGAVLTAAQLCGLSRRMLDMSVAYANDREQFGQPIGAFQAVKHQIATVYTQIEFTRPMVHLAAIKGGAAVHSAKIAAIDTSMLAAETAIQVHGGMGYTFEVDLHLFMKRAWALCGEWGDRNYHIMELEKHVFSAQTERGPGTTFHSLGVNNG